MRREKVEKTIITTVLTLWWLLMPMTGYERGYGMDMGDMLMGHLLYPLSHANIWHLAGNLFVLWMLPGRLWLWQSLLISFVCSWLPVAGLWDIGMTVGFSSVLFAIIGMQWGRWLRRERQAGASFKAYWTFFRRSMAYVLIGALLPNVNWCIHLYCVLTGLMVGRYCRLCKDR